MRLLKTREAAEYLSISYAALLSMRKAGIGPKWIKLTEKGTYRYRKEDLDEYLEDRKHASFGNAG